MKFYIRLRKTLVLVKLIISLLKNIIVFKKPANKKADFFDDVPTSITCYLIVINQDNFLLL